MRHLQAIKIREPAEGGLQLWQRLQYQPAMPSLIASSSGKGCWFVM